MPPLPPPKRLTVADLRHHSRPSEGHPSRPAALVAVADNFQAVAMGLSSLLAPRYHVAAPIQDTTLLRQVASIMDNMVIIVELDLSGTPTLDVITDLVCGRDTLRVVVHSAFASTAMRSACLFSGAYAIVDKRAGVTEFFRVVEDAIVDLGSRAAVRGECTEQVERVGVKLLHGSRKHRDLVLWALESGFTQRSIATATGLALTTVEHHSRSMRRGDPLRRAESPVRA